jgi:anti-sigma factor RsiW
VSQRELLEAWLDGRLSAEERRAFEARLAAEPALAREAELARRVGGFLARRFQPPATFRDPRIVRAELGELASAAASATRPEQRAGQRAGVRLLRASTWAWLAAAALVLAVVRLGTLGAPRPGGGDAADTARVERARGLVPVPWTGQEVERPDLASLYARAVHMQTPVDSCAEPEDPSARQLQLALASRHGEEVELCAEASDVLYGPYRLEEWPSGTVLTGFPDGPGGAPSVVVAETDARFRCCVAIDLPAESELNLFTWRVGKLFLTEITPHREPRLLQCFDPVQ